MTNANMDTLMVKANDLVAQFTELTDKAIAILRDKAIAENVMGIPCQRYLDHAGVMISHKVQVLSELEKVSVSLSMWEDCPMLNNDPRDKVTAWLSSFCDGLGSHLAMLSQ